MNGQLMTQVFPMGSASDPAGRLAALFDVHYDRLYRLARRLVPTADDALDLVQDTFLRAARSPNTVPVGVRNEEAWLVRVLVNIRRDQWRHASVLDRFNRNTKTGGSEIASAGRDPEAAMIARTTVWKALDLLPPRRRTVIVMYELEGLEISSIASLLGVSSITIRWHLSRGRQELARVIKPEGMQRIGGTE
jgi:RNA polymerase sigma-70 factor (ECF subfamily)